jgi:hypothetical protein
VCPNSGGSALFTAFLRRNLSSCPANMRTKCYTTFVRPQLEYASYVWAPHTQSNINKLELVQRRAARFATGNYNTTSSVRERLCTIKNKVSGVRIWLPGFPFWRIPGPRLLLWPRVVSSITRLWMERRTRFTGKKSYYKGVICHIHFFVTFDLFIMYNCCVNKYMYWPL